jgi:mannose-6-phosphate isomerase-like protein (cupin superfamily)
MNDFPDFMKNPANRIAEANQATPGVEGYVFDGVDGGQMAFWTCRENAASAAHTHDYDEYMVVVQGCYTLIINGERIPMKAGEEYLIPRGVQHSGEVLRGQERSMPLEATGPSGPSLIRERSEPLSVIRSFFLLNAGGSSATLTLPD